MTSFYSEIEEDNQKILTCARVRQLSTTIFHQDFNIYSCSSTGQARPGQAKGEGIDTEKQRH